ncbi:protein of unknown function [Shewanella benthica]|uniref:Uncharacterized protein n=1 Tax=Shewanella benthica TaxID=43661 RepID=A0A330M617_9GAMM|nr:protein of unknown function [Shewanella benthica]
MKGSTRLINRWRFGLYLYALWQPSRPRFGHTEEKVVSKTKTKVAANLEYLIKIRALVYGKSFWVTRALDSL